jgi:hypothetical protein
MRTSLPVKIVALVGLVLAIAIGVLGTFVLVHRTVTSGPVPAAVPAKTKRPDVHGAARTSRPRIDSGLPAPLRAALARSTVVVAALNAPGVPGDAAAVSEARQGARAAHAGFAVLDVRNEAIAAALAAKAPNATDPAVLVVRRPGTIAVELDGYADRQTVAQAAANVHR